MVTFQDLVWSYYHNNKRDFAWRNTTDPYEILVSEIMLQQTQTHRVIHKFTEFVSTFLTIEDLANASLQQVLSVWQGLGYYRRAYYLHQAAQTIVKEHHGLVPADPTILQTLPGIGVNTAGSICAFAYNMPTVFVETNIRAVFIHHFYPHNQVVSDKQIVPLIKETLDVNSPRLWYYALMDYGVWIKKTYKNPSKKSVHYNKQSCFKGSHREVRAAVLKCIVNHGVITKGNIFDRVSLDSGRIEIVLQELEKEQLICHSNNTYRISNKV